MFNDCVLIRSMGLNFELVVMLILCLWVFVKVDKLWLSGHREEAFQRSAQAKKWSIVGIVVGMVCHVLIVVMSITASAITAANNS